MFERSSSEPASVDSGVPQGTEISPLLFLYHIDNLACAVSSQVRLFADDCLPYQEINTYTDHHILQEDLKRLETWADTWGMRFNARKCHILSIKPKSSFFYCLYNTILKQITTNPYLGILLSEDLQWTPNIANITK